MQVSDEPGLIVCPEEIHGHAQWAGRAHGLHHADSGKGVCGEVLVHLTVGLLGDEEVSGIAETYDLGGAGASFVKEAKFLDGVEQRGVYLREFEREIVFAAELDLLPESAVGTEIEELINAACADIQPGAGFFPFVQALQLP